MTHVRKGFTLVELLIAVLIIGILASAITLIRRSSSASADTAAIIQNLRDLRAACMQLHLSDARLRSRWFDPNRDGVDITWLAPYMTNPGNFGPNSPYVLAFVQDTATGSSELTWWVGFDLFKGGKGIRIADRLAGRARLIGLYKDHHYNHFTKIDSVVWMVAR
ncbi:MAG: prepilin-type N-terminal cleavage/methylation domain-containing protein [Synergistaceae bacterium]|nr:prepilin-type N-terminal cleavage/methylation domain-containing protein [Synergistaceae bacterium]